MATTIQIKRGTGSAVPSGLEDGELAINLDNGKLFFGSGSTSINSFRFENLTAENYIVSSSVTNITTQELSGSTNFGNSSDDTHTFTGNITASGDISASGNITVNSLNSTTAITASNISIGANIIHTGDPDTAITFGVNSIRLLAGGELLYDAKSTGLDISRGITSSADISASGTITANSFTGNGLSIDGPSNAHIEVGEYPVGYDTLALNTVFITGSGLIVSGAMADANHHNMVKIGNVELIDLNTALSPNEFLIHNVSSFKITSGSDSGDIAGGYGRLFEHNGTDFKLYRNNSEVIGVNATTTTFNNTNVSFAATPFFRAAVADPGTNSHFLYTTSDPGSSPKETKSVKVGDMFKALTGNVTASAVSASGTITAATLDAAAVSDTLAAAIVAEIDNDEIPIAKLAEDAVTVTAGTGLTGGGSITLGGSATVNVIGGTGVTANANDIAIGQDVATTANVQFANITSSANISASGNIISNNLEVSNNITAVSASIPGVIVGNPNLLSLGDPDGNVAGVRAEINQNGTTSLLGNTTLNLKGSVIKLIDGGDNGTARIELSGPVTASGNISASGDLSIFEFTSVSASLATQITDSASLASRIATNAGSITTNLALVSGAFDADSASFASLINTNNALVSGANQNNNVTFAEITASGNISSSGDITANNLTVDLEIQRSGDADTKIAFATNQVSIKAGNTVVFESTITGSVLTNTHQIIYDTGSVALAANSAMGDIVKFGGTTTTAGGVYFLNSSGGWTLTQANAAATSTGSLAVAVGTNSTTHGMCLRGFINPFTDPSAGIGSPVYLSDTHTGRLLAAPPSDENDVVRIVGYQYGPDLIYFNPSNDYIVHA